MIYFSIITLIVGIVFMGLSFYEYNRNEQPSAYLLLIASGIMLMGGGVAFFYCA